jgi:hypothetical protein
VSTPEQALGVTKRRSGKNTQITKRAQISVERIERTIVRVRGHNVVLASDLALFYGVQTRALNQAVKRNADRFPVDFAFRLRPAEISTLKRSRSQTVILKRGRNIKYAPLAFTEHGAIMVASVLSSPGAVQMSIFVVRAFLQMREWVASRAELADRLAVLERRVGAHDRDLNAVLSAMRRLIASPISAQRRIGYVTR